MENITCIDECSFINCFENSSNSKKVRANFWITFLAVVGVIISAAALVVGVVALVVSFDTYNSRYDADAQAAGGLEFTFEANGKTSGSGSFTASVGSITYGYFQKEGSSNTEYTLYKKASTSSNYDTLKNLTVYGNYNYTGDFEFAYNSSSTRYDVKCDKNNNSGTKSVFEFDWGI